MHGARPATATAHGEICGRRAEVAVNSSSQLVCPLTSDVQTGRPVGRPGAPHIHGSTRTRPGTVANGLVSCLGLVWHGVLGQARPVLATGPFTARPGGRQNI
jgi:hypothetical protein